VIIQAEKAEKAEKSEKAEQNVESYVCPLQEEATINDESSDDEFSSKEKSSLETDISNPNEPINQQTTSESEIPNPNEPIPPKVDANCIHVALKELRSSDKEKKIRFQDFDSFMREAHIMAPLSHPNVIQLYGFCRHPPQVFV
jgi:hypothetical protein